MTIELKEKQRLAVRKRYAEKRAKDDPVSKTNWMCIGSESIEKIYKIYGITK